ncbi:hypothetical protein L198_00177 [Cryptococcus wingfieldii CBS 7118]|uniref:Uncharacterized protein n=1 Tax=Cryptococcus wingfieldii CBS 7118 TaxID=1295528 RepID=A0A1E3K7D5_9TREE|nr:hypothetical protein L198_00177 [Cryptococcus wingfieldii CBS 7118]ODO08447.1 hypothetical protein L198_00177 [Cryptococcus wingfieldii CBS 7118]
MTYPQSWLCKEYEKWMSEKALKNPDLAFTASLRYTYKRAEGSKTNESCTSKNSLLYTVFDLKDDELLDIVCPAVFEVKSIVTSAATALVQEAAYLLGDHAACGWYLGGFAVDRGHACMIVLDDKTVLFEVPNGIPPK